MTRKRTAAVEFRTLAPPSRVHKPNKPPMIEQRCGDCGEEWRSTARFVVCPTKTCASPNVYVVRTLDPADRIASLADAPKGGVRRHSTGSPELDRLLGGGAPERGVILIVGEPGAGKTHTLVQTCYAMAERRGTNTLYATGEQGEEKIQEKVEEIGIDPNSEAAFRTKVVRTTRLTELLRLIETAKPSFLVVDSIQSINDDLPEDFRRANGLATPRGPETVTWALIQVTQRSKQRMVTFLISQVNAEGDARGGQGVPHAVDVVMTLTIHKETGLRRMAVGKSREGTSGLAAVFEKRNGRVVSVARHTANATRKEAGVVAYIGGSPTEPLCYGVECEVGERVEGRMAAAIQCEGVAESRVDAVMAQLRRHLGADFRGRDTLLELALGTEPQPSERGLDLALAAAVLSAYTRRAGPDRCCYFGEVGVKGDVKHAADAERRAATAKRRGFVRVVCAEADAAEVRKAGVEAVPVRHVVDLVSIFGPVPKAERVSAEEARREAGATEV